MGVRRSRDPSIRTIQPHEAASVTGSLRLFPRAIALWWREFAFLLVLNFAWLLAQVTIIFGPPATAALAAIAARVLDGELSDFGEFVRAARANFGAAWRWGLAQWIVYGVLGFNMIAYAGTASTGILALRYAWTLMAVAWFAVNLYYWPLYFEESDRRFSITMGNALKMVTLNPALTTLYALLALACIVISTLSGLLLGAVLGTWLALWGALVVRHLLAKE